MCISSKARKGLWLENKSILSPPPPPPHQGWETYCFFPVRPSVGLTILSNIVKSIPPTVLTESFWNYAGVCVKVWTCPWRMTAIFRLIFVTFLLFELVYFWLKAYRHWVSCERNSFYSLSRIFLIFAGVFVKVWRCAWRLTVLLRLIFCHYFRSLNLVIIWLKAYRH